MILHVLPTKNPAEHNRKESETQRVTREKKEQEEREKKIEKEYKVWYRVTIFLIDKACRVTPFPYRKWL